MFAFLSSLVIKGPSFARMYFFLHRACFSRTPFVILLQSFKNVIVMDRDTNDVSLIRCVNRMSIPAGHSPIV